MVRDAAITSPGRSVAVAGALIAALMLAGCTAAPSTPELAPTPAATPPPTSTPTQTYESLPQPTDAPRNPAVVCTDDRLIGTSTWTQADGAWFETGVIGEGSTVAVFVPQSGENYCGFGEFARVLAGLGIQSVLINLCGIGETTCGPEDHVVTSGANAVLAAAEQARADGATRVVAVGASMGGTTVIVASAQSGQDGPLDGVADLSGPLEFRGVDTLALASGIAVPMLLAASNDDSVVSPEQLDQLGEASGGDFELLGGTGHGWAMLFARTATRTLTDTGQSLVDFVMG